MFVGPPVSIAATMIAGFHEDPTSTQLIAYTVGVLTAWAVAAAASDSPVPKKTWRCLPVAVSPR